MNFNQFVSVIRARWTVVLTVGIVAMLTALIVSLLLPKKYTASASVIVDFAADPVSGALFGPMMTSSIIATQVDVLQSDRVARKVIATLKLDEDPAVKQQWLDDTGGKGTIADWLVDPLERQLNVVPSKESNVITIEYKAQNGQAAAAFANAFAQGLVDTAVELRVDPAKQYTGFFDQRIKDARARIQAAQQKYGEFQRDNGITGSDEQVDVEMMRLNELSTQLVGVQTLAGDTTSQQQAAVSGKADRLQAALQSPVISSLKVDLSRAEANLQLLLNRFGENHPQVTEARANIAELRDRVEAETRRVTGGVGVSASVNNARVAELRTELEAQRQKVLKMKDARNQMIVLQRDIDAAQKDYDAVGMRASQSSLESKTQQSNVNMLSRAAEPTQPSSPKILLNTAAALVLGLIFGLTIAFVRELLDRRIRVGDDITQLLGLPILGVLPKPLGVGKYKTGKVSLMAQRVISGRLPAPGKSN